MRVHDEKNFTWIVFRRFIWRFNWLPLRAIVTVGACLYDIQIKFVLFFLLDKLKCNLIIDKKVSERTDYFQQIKQTAEFCRNFVFANKIFLLEYQRSDLFLLVVWKKNWLKIKIKRILSVCTLRIILRDLCCSRFNFTKLVKQFQII